MAEFAKFRSNMEENTSLQSSTDKMLGAISERARASNHRIIVLTTEGVKVARAHKGFLLCDYTVPNGVLDENGNWHAGAIATLMDNIGTLATFSYVPAYNVSVDFSISFSSTAKVQEEVEVEAKVVGNKGKLTCVAVQVRKKENGELIASSKQWMAATNVMAGLRTNLCFLMDLRGLYISLPFLWTWRKEHEKLRILIDSVSLHGAVQLNSWHRFAVFSMKNGICHAEAITTSVEYLWKLEWSLPRFVSVHLLMARVQVIYFLFLKVTFLYRCCFSISSLL